MLMQSSPLPPCPDCPPMGPLEAFFALSVAFCLLFFLILLLLPEPWTDAIWRVVFPFAPRKPK